MNARRPVPLLKELLFASALLASVAVREGPSPVVNQAIIWLPTGVALAGLWILGASRWWVVMLCTVAQRLLIGYPIRVAIPAGFGSTAEALLGVLVLNRLEFRASLARLRDVGVLFVAAAVAPLGSILCSWIGRSLVWERGTPFYSGWDGWWRMNALGVLTVLPVALTALATSWTPIRARTAGHVALIGAAIVGILIFLMNVVPGGTTGVLCLTLVLPIALYAAVRFGPRGAAAAGALAAVVVAVSATRGIGPFLAVPLDERHVALQLFEMTITTFPLVIGALIAERQDALLSGTQSEERRQAIQEALPDLAYRLRSDGTCIDMYVPSGVESLYRHEDLVGRNGREFLPGALAGRFEELIRKVLAERRTVTVEYDLPWHGRTLAREARCVPYGANEILAVVRDITPRKRIEATKRFEALVLERVATGSPATEVISELVEGMEQLVPDARCRIRTRGRLPARGDDPDALPPPDAGNDAGSARPGHWSLPIRDSAGALLGEFEVTYREPRGPDPEERALVERAAALAGIAFERERRVEALRKSEDLLASINRNLNEGLFRLTPDLRLIYANQAFARFFGYAAPEQILDPSNVMLEEHPDGAEQLRRLTAPRSGAGSEEVQLRRRDGTGFWGLVSSTEVRGPDGRTLHWDGAVADISARKDLEAQFRQSQKMDAVGKLAGGVAHDFNNLLTAIFGYAESIQQEAGDASAIGRYAQGVLTAGERAAGLTRQLLAYSRQQVLSPQVLEIDGVVEQLGDMLRRLIDERITLEFRPGAPRGRVRVDRGQLEQVVLNLVVNARDAMPAGGTLTLATETVTLDEAAARAQVDLAAGSHVVLCVSDTGTGMTSEVQARAFDPFFTTKDQGKGTGLGLSTVYGIVKQSGGSVRLESLPGRGTSVWIHLPCVEADLDVELPPPPVGPVPRDATVLIVEDEPVVRELVRETLRHEGYAVLEADDGLSALEMCRRHPGGVDLVVTDVIMPRMGGRELADRLLAEQSTIRILFMSGYSNDSLDLREFPESTTDFIAKPFSSREMLERIHGLLHPGAVGA